MSASKNHFNTSDTQTRKRHEVVLTVNSPISKATVKTTTAQESIHVSPTPKAFEAREERRLELKNKAEMPIETMESTPAAEEISSVEEVTEVKEEVRSERKGVLGGGGHTAENLSHGGRNVQS